MDENRLYFTFILPPEADAEWRSNASNRAFNVSELFIFCGSIYTQQRKKTTPCVWQVMIMIRARRNNNQHDTAAASLFATFFPMPFH